MFHTKVLQYKYLYLTTHTAQKDCSNIVATFQRKIAILHKRCEMLLQGCCKIAAMVKCPLLEILLRNIVAILQ